MPIGQLTFAQQDIGGVCNVEAKDDRRNYTATTTTATTTTTTTAAVLSSGYPAVMPQRLGPLLQLLLVPVHLKLKPVHLFVCAKN